MFALYLIFIRYSIHSFPFEPGTHSVEMMVLWCLLSICRTTLHVLLNSTDQTKSISLENWWEKIPFRSQEPYNLRSFLYMIDMLTWLLEVLHPFLEVLNCCQSFHDQLYHLLIKFDWEWMLESLIRFNIKHNRNGIMSWYNVPGLLQVEPFDMDTKNILRF